MKEFKTISERDILRYASYDIMERMSREEEINKNTIKEYGHENSIALHHLAKQEAQLKEIGDRILEIERGN